LYLLPAGRADDSPQDPSPAPGPSSGVRCQQQRPTDHGRQTRSNSTMSTPTKDSFSAISALLTEESFRPAQPRNLEEAGLGEARVDSLICKHLAVTGNESGRSIAENVCLSFGMLEERFQKLRTRQLITHRGAAPLNDYVYALTDQGREYAQRQFE